MRKIITLVVALLLMAVAASSAAVELPIYNYTYVTGDCYSQYFTVTHNSKYSAYVTSPFTPFSEYEYRDANSSDLARFGRIVARQIFKDQAHWESGVEYPYGGTKRIAEITHIKETYVDDNGAVVSNDVRIVILQNVVNDGVYILTSYTSGHGSNCAFWRIDDSLVQCELSKLVGFNGYCGRPLPPPPNPDTPQRPTINRITPTPPSGNTGSQYPARTCERYPQLCK